MDIDIIFKDITLNDLSIEFLLKIGFNFYTKFRLSNDNKKEIYRSNVISIAKELLKRLDLYYYKTELSTISKTITTKEYNDINQFFYYTTT